MTLLSPINRAKLTLSFEILVFALAQEIIVHGRPFTLVEDSGMQEIINPLLKAMKSKDIK